ncbi:hypothetical protein BTA51_04820 [Hahella sp. CCB-MM4]|uniref:hypothetical protein n=1 Tax=Hahella sp. (strain CCB-MM4) TaxID=1926491 RepID=UPI000B9AF6FC|nr:hypothetical protein [Hahella sp. CCB-MM4]OZG74338.1 hypothetical protein BTA51_04820 [Hahella sp. CCB-MM4]
MSLLRTFSLTALSVALAACASKPVDNTPSNPTSVLKANYTLNGLYAPDFSGKQTVYTRGDRRRIDSQTNFDSFLMRWANSDKSDIARVDKKLIWNLDNDKENYRECPMSGCTEVSLLDQLKDRTDSQEEDSEEYESYEEMGCQVTLASNDFDVTPTGKERVIGGLNAHEYTVEWKTEFADQAGKKDTNLVKFVFWTTEPTADMNAAWKVNRAFQESYFEEAKNDPLKNLLGKEGYMALAAFSGDVEKTDAKQYKGFLKALNKIKGYPLSIKLEWFQQANACQTQRSPKSKEGLDLSNGLEGAAMGMVGDFLSNQKDKIIAEWKKDALVRYIYEVTYVSEDMVKDSVFNVPYGYVLADRQ